MPLYELTPSSIVPIPTTTFSAEKIHERMDIQPRLRDQIEIIAPDCLVLSEEFCEWDDSKRRIDLLCVDKSANLVVIELKRTEDGGAMDLQALRYAAMVSTMTFDQAVRVYARYLSLRDDKRDAETTILDFLGWESAEDGLFAEDVKIVLVSGSFSRELTSSVMWLNERDLDIRCVQLRPYKHADRILLDIEQVLPLKEAEDYQVRVREKEREERRARASSRDYTKYNVTLDGALHERLPKRAAILAVVRHLCSKGRTPEEVLEAVPWRRSKFYWTVEGELDSAQFCERARADAQRADRVFDPTRWFVDDDELVRAQGRTYALSSQWGSGTADALAQFMRTFPKDGVQVEAAG